MVVWGGEDFGPGVGLCPCQNFVLLPAQGHVAEMLTSERMGKDGMGTLTSIFSSQPHLISPAQSLSPVDIPGAGGLAASPSECWEGRGEALKYTPVNKPFFCVARWRRASPVELERSP